MKEPCLKGALIADIEVRGAPFEGPVDYSVENAPAQFLDSRFLASRRIAAIRSVLRRWICDNIVIEKGF